MLTSSCGVASDSDPLGIYQKFGAVSQDGVCRFFYVCIFPWWSLSAELPSLPAGSDEEEARCAVNFRGVYLFFLNEKQSVFFCTSWK